MYLLFSMYYLYAHRKEKREFILNNFDRVGHMVVCDFKLNAFVIYTVILVSI